MEKLQTNNETSFKAQLNKINTVNFPIGDGVDDFEPSDLAIDRIVNHDFAGVFRNGVAKLIFLITDAPPSGTNDRYTQEDINDVLALKDDCNAQSIKVILFRPFYFKPYDPQGTDRNYTVLDDLAYGTGGDVYSMDTSNIIYAIQNICITNT